MEEVYLIFTFLWNPHQNSVNAFVAFMQDYLKSRMYSSPVGMNNGKW